MYYPPNRRFIALVLLLIAAIAIAVITVSLNLADDPYNAVPRLATTGILPQNPYTSRPNDLDLSEEALKGAAIAPALGNETAKAELGRAAWKLFHTTFARFPDKPKADEQAALRAYIYLFARLYPCGECAKHFADILKKYPPQVSTRSAAATWGCYVHNLVNKDLGKEEFDCSKIGDFYHCGCAEEGADKDHAAEVHLRGDEG